MIRRSPYLKNKLDEDVQVSRVSSNSVNVFLDLCKHITTLPANRPWLHLQDVMTGVWDGNMVSYGSGEVRNGPNAPPQLFYLFLKTQQCWLVFLRRGEDVSEPANRF